MKKSTQAELDAKIAKVKDLGDKIATHSETFKTKHVNGFDGDLEETLQFFYQGRCLYIDMERAYYDMKASIDKAR